jgi:predicted nucleic acid-binding protein
VAERPTSSGWRDALVIGGAVVVVVLAVELASDTLAPVHDAFARFPTTIVILVAGTLGILGAAILRRPR